MIGASDSPDSPRFPPESARLAAILAPKPPPRPERCKVCSKSGAFQSKEIAPNLRFSGKNRAIRKKWPFVKKRACGFGSGGLNTPSPAALRCTAGAENGPDGSGNAGGRQRDARKQKVIQAGRAGKSQGASQFVLSSRSLKLLVTEEICGRFGPCDGSTSAYRAGRLRPMIQCQLHCLAVSGFRWNQKHRAETILAEAGQDDVQRFERQG